MRVLVLVHDDLRHFRGRERTADELCRVGRPVDDVDLLAAKLLHDRLHARAAHADAGADRIDVAIVGDHRDLRASTRLTNCGLDLDDALVDLGHFLTEELDQAGSGVSG